MPTNGYFSILWTLQFKEKIYSYGSANEFTVFVCVCMFEVTIHDSLSSRNGLTELTNA